MNLNKGTLLEEEGAKKFMRILESHKQDNWVVCIEFDDNGYAREMPKLLSYEYVHDKITSGFYRKAAEDKFFETRTVVDFTPDENKRIEARWAIIEELVDNSKVGSSIFNPEGRIKLTKAIVKGFKIKRRKLNDYLKRYWVRGPSKYALASDYENSGAPGQIREPGKAKRGRRTKKIGINITKQDRGNIKKIAKQFLYTKEGTLESAYDELLLKYYSTLNKKGEWEENRLKPSFSQFIDWSGKLITSKEKIIGKEGLLNFKKNFRQLEGKANDNVVAAGYEYQIDWSGYAVNIVSSTNRNEVIGTLIVYFVRDVASRMYVGYYATIEGASYSTGRLAVEHAICDKDEWAKRNKLEMPKGEWPCKGVPVNLYGDRGEFVSKKSDVLVNNLYITLDSAPSYRSEMKGVIEVSFMIGKRRMRPLLKKHGLVDRNPLPRQGNADKKNAKLTLAEVSEIIFITLLEKNRSYLKDYPLTNEMCADGVKPIPIELWKWFEKRGEIKLRAINENNLRKLLLPQMDVRLYRGGLKFSGKDYVPVDKKAFEILEGLRLNGIDRGMVAFDPRFLSDIFWVYKNNFYLLRSRGRKEAQFENYWEMISSNRFYANAKNEHDESFGKFRRNNTRKIKAIVETASSKQPNNKMVFRKNSEARQKEIQRIRDKEFKQRPQTKMETKALSTSPPSKYSGRKDYSALSKQRK
jgi:hypothetical protein